MQFKRGIEPTNSGEDPDDDPQILAVSHQTDRRCERKVRSLSFIHRYTMTDSSLRHTMHIISLTVCPSYTISYNILSTKPYPIPQKANHKPTANNNTHPSPKSTNQEPCALDGPQSTNAATKAPGSEHTVRASEIHCRVLGSRTERGSHHHAVTTVLRLELLDWMIENLAGLCPRG
jgi:hypothetical protein